MTAISSIDGVLVVYRMTPEERGQLFLRKEDQPRDPCVWLQSLRPIGEGLTTFHVFFPDQAVLMLEDLSKIKWDKEERKEQIGSVSLRSEREYSAEVRAERIRGNMGYRDEFELYVANFWEEFPFPQAIEELKAAVADPVVGKITVIAPKRDSIEERFRRYIDSELKSGYAPLRLYPLTIMKPEGA